ncbi:MAG: superoxide dismutase [Patescibacteria group bacterium]
MFTLPNLPYERAALEPHMSAKTLDFHYGKHHQAYVDNLNKLLAGTELEKESLENIILKSANNAERTGIFNNAAQHFNHTFFWDCLRPAAKGSAPSEPVSAALSQSFGSLEMFYTEFKIAAASLFGSGWVWLVKDGEQLKILKTANGDNPIAHGLKPVFALDVWEHSYYLDYQNRRADFVEAVLQNLINWEFVAKNI